MNLQELKTEFLKRFPKGAEKIRFFTAPSCVNLSGGYTHRGEISASVALSMGTIIAVRRRGDRKLCIQSTERDIQIEADLDLPEEYKGLEWGSYQLGIAGELIKHGYKLVGADMLYYDTIPENFTLSQTAPTGIATAVAMASLGGIADIDRVEMAKIARRAEIYYIKSDSGITDYFTSAMGKKNNVVLLNCKNLDYKFEKLDMKGYKLVIADTYKKKAMSEHSGKEIEFFIKKMCPDTRIVSENCSVSIVRDEEVDAFIEKVENFYNEKIGYAPLFYVADTSDGVRELFLD